MAYSNDRLKSIYDSTSGYCHLCGKKLAFINYGKSGFRAAWEVEHSKPKSKGDTDHLNNLFPACISCNREKGKKHNRFVRKKNGIVRAPLSIKTRKKAQLKNAAKLGAIGGTIGLLFGPIGAITGVALGAGLGYEKNPDKD